MKSLVLSSSGGQSALLVQASHAYVFPSRLFLFLGPHSLAEEALLGEQELAVIDENRPLHVLRRF
jgi:hypothetical protein